MGFMVCPFMIIWRCRCPPLEYTRDIWQSPHRSIYRLAWLCLTGRLSDKDVRRLYSCTLCNKCWLAPFNRITRDMAVGRGIVPPHLAAIRGHIDGTGNPYGVLRDGGSPEQEDRCDTLLFVGCTGRYRTPEIIEAARKLLASKGIKHYTMPDETCCGYTLYNLGDRQSAEKAISANLAKFKASGVRRIVTVCPGCYTALTSLYRGREGFDADVFLALDLLQGLSAEARDAVVHDPCHAKGRHDLVRKMAKGAPDEGTGGCCGAGGGLISWDSVMAGSRARTIMGESGRKVITYCPLCYLNFKRADPAGVSDLYVLLASHGVSQPD
jgi:Fe-S oxidoreductase